MTTWKLKVTILGSLFGMINLEDIDFYILQDLVSKFFVGIAMIILLVSLKSYLIPSGVAKDNEAIID